jgi:hypothetical protein
MSVTLRREEIDCINSLVDSTWGIEYKDYNKRIGYICEVFNKLHHKPKRPTPVIIDYIVKRFNYIEERKY